MYADTIRRFTTIDPRWVEASMRLQYGTLDHLSDEDFAVECEVAEEMARLEGSEAMETLARSYGL